MERETIRVEGISAELASERPTLPIKADAYHELIEEQMLFEIEFDDAWDSIEINWEE